jgi:lipoprotein signal peptidase
MKIYSQLIDIEKDFAVDKAIEVLVKQLVATDFDYQFKSLIAQKHFFQSFAIENQGIEFQRILESDEIVEELTPCAVAIAEMAFYPEDGELFFEGIAA